MADCLLLLPRAFVGLAEAPMRQNGAPLRGRRSQEVGYLGYEFQARRALGEIAIKEGKVSEGHAALKALKADAAAKGFGSIVNEATLLITDAERSEPHSRAPVLGVLVSRGHI
jgi:hypothetical protein